MTTILIFFDLQEILKDIGVGDFPENPYISPYSETPAALCVVDLSGTKTVRVIGRADQKPGLSLNTPAIKTLYPGDRITVTGRLGGGVPKGDWAMAIDRQTSREDYDGLAQHLNPKHGALYSITYLLDKPDLENPLLVRSNHWGKDTGRMEFYVDSILITRNSAAMNTTIDNRREVYSLATDENLKNLRPGHITKFLRSSGTPKYTVFEKNGRKGIHLGRRTNNWDGIDIRLASMDLKPGNLYTIQVKGRIDGNANSGARMMFQFLPDYVWRSEIFVSSNQDFVLSHTLSIMELLTAKAVRVATCDDSTNMSFYIYDIEITAKG